MYAAADGRRGAKARMQAWKEVCDGRRDNFRLSTVHASGSGMLTAADVTRSVPVHKKRQKVRKDREEGEVRGKDIGHGKGWCDE